MIVEFSLGNYRSFNEIQTLSFRATGLVSEDRTVDENNIVEVAGQRLLKTVGVYGANASGKSNLIKGLTFMRGMVLHSLNSETYLSDFISPNLQIQASEDNSVFFQIVLLIDSIRYRYGFTLEKNCIKSEWLFGPAEKNETSYFKRKLNSIDINKEYFSEGMTAPYQSSLRRDTLFITFCSAYNGNISGTIKDFFSNRLENGNEIRVNDFTRMTNQFAKKGATEAMTVLTWLKDIGLEYKGIRIEDIVSQNIVRPFEISGRTKLIKYTYGSNGEVNGDIEVDLMRNESDGTQKYYALIGQLYEKFEKGGTLVIDEIDSNFHPTLLRKIIGMFNNPAINKANAQLLFTSHDTNLMSPEIMRRDQFYFTEKSPTDSTQLYSLSDLKGIRNNADFAKQYLAGYYGALPILGNLLETQANPE